MSFAEKRLYVAFYDPETGLKCVSGLYPVNCIPCPKMNFALVQNSQEVLHAI